MKRLINLPDDEAIWNAFNEIIKEETGDFKINHRLRIVSALNIQSNGWNLQEVRFGTRKNGGPIPTFAIWFHKELDWSCTYHKGEKGIDCHKCNMGWTLGKECRCRCLNI